MKTKLIILIFLTGLTAGLILSPFSLTRPKQVFESPVSLSMAESKDYRPDFPKGEVLSVYTEEISKETKMISNLAVNPEATMTALEISRLRIQEASQGKEPIVVNNRQGQLKIAFLGDSMTDTMGEGLPYIEKFLKKYYPNYFFEFLNYGAGGTNIDYGIERLTNDYQYLGKNIPALVSVNPDIVVVESFAYNPWGGEKSDLDHHWLSMAKIVDILRQQTKAKILFLATIAPNRANFGGGPAGVNWSDNQAREHAEKINLYLENTVRFAESQRIPVVDAYHPSLVNGDGNLNYINPGDHIHPSVAGCEFVAKLIAEKLVSLGWL